MTSTTKPRLTKTAEGYECTIGHDVYRLRPTLDNSGWSMTVGSTGGEYVGTVDHFCRLVDAREFLAEVAAATA